MSNATSCLLLRNVERNFINIHNTSRDMAYSIHIIHVIRLDDARSDVSQSMDADDELELSLSAVVIATIAKKRKKRRQVRSCWVRPWLCSCARFGGYEAHFCRSIPGTSFATNNHTFLKSVYKFLSLFITHFARHLNFFTECDVNYDVLRHDCYN